MGDCCSSPGGDDRTEVSVSESLSAALRRASKKSGIISVTGRYHQLPQKLADKYDATRQVLGSGYSGEVFTATNKINGETYAVKSFKLHGVSHSKFVELRNELEIFLAMDHPHVVRLTDVYESDDHLDLVMECMSGGELFQRVVKQKTFSEQAASFAIQQMLWAVNYLHSHNVVHRDLKLENFLYETDESDNLKLIDFGFSKVWKPNTKMKLSCGTLSYMAPEVLDMSYTSKCDLWSMGVIAFILLVGYMPFVGTEDQQIEHILSGTVLIKKHKWSNISKVGKDFAMGLLNVDPTKRPSAEEALRHEWFEKIDRHTTVDSEMCESLAEFSHMSQFRRACMQVVAWSLTQQERQQLRDEFQELDTAKTGTIKLVDLKRLLQERYIVTDKEAAAVFDALDSNHDGEIEYSEFLAATLASRVHLHDHLLQAAFGQFDKDNSGFISLENLRSLMGKDFDLKQVKREVEVSDGKISYEAFIAYLKNGGSVEHIEEVSKIIDDNHVGVMKMVSVQ
uniref:Calmodulin n=1 Tax=Noctiluca scintillans TaxID=2966 RepID=A0A7S0ZP70_NOCSC|mmetsp:Transcript_12952/g.35802  ORF Transcript_12952/g.35802 Transcript_12952/m.35802 type:complete len:509 (+) Transcript_12952:95-1621(+)